MKSFQEIGKKSLQVLFTNFHKLMNTGYTLNRVNFTQDEETCILKFLREAQECGYPSGNEPYYPLINSILRKYYDSDVKEAQVIW